MSFTISPCLHNSGIDIWGLRSVARHTSVLLVSFLASYYGMPSVYLLLVHIVDQLCYLYTFDLVNWYWFSVGHSVSVPSRRVLFFLLGISLSVDILSGLILRGYQGEGASDPPGRSPSQFRLRLLMVVFQAGFDLCSFISSWLLMVWASVFWGYFSAVCIGRCWCFVPGSLLVSIFHCCRGRH